jgi:multidrug resistance efflux pump
MTATDWAPRAEDESATEPATDGDRPAERRPAPPAAQRLKRSTKIALVVIAMVSVLEALAFAGTYFGYSRHYVSTDNAQVDGDRIPINAPVAGTVTDWLIDEGSVVRENQVVGRIQGVGSGAQPKRTVRAPRAGTIAVNTVVAGQYVPQGTMLATAYDPDSIYITARVAEHDIADVHIGQQVDVSVDAYPGTPVLGLVTQVEAAAAGQFTLWPSSDTDPTNPQRVDQYIPVRISVTNGNGLRLLPGMNVVAKIRRG